MDTQDIPAINETIAVKFRKIEMAIASEDDVARLFEGLLTGIEKEFAVPFVWLSVLREPETKAFLGLLAESGLLRDRLNVIDPAAFREIVPDDTRPVLASGDVRPFFRLMPPARKYFVRSLAVSPFFLRGRLIGSINHGDASPDRYRPEMDATLLGRLARRVSERLDRILIPVV